MMSVAEIIERMQYFVEQQYEEAGMQPDAILFAEQARIARMVCQHYGLPVTDPLPDLMVPTDAHEKH